MKPLCLRGQEWKRLRERFAKESCGAVKGFPLGFPAPLPWSSPNCGRGEVSWVSTLSLVPFFSLFLFVYSGRGRQPTYMKRRREGGSLILRRQGGRRRPQVEATDALVIQLTPCCQSVLAVMLAKAGVSAGFTYYWIWTNDSRRMKAIL